MVAISKATGSQDLLWPEGATVETIPDDLLIAIDQAVRVLSWLENLSSDEVPPSWMWHLDWKLEEWFEQVERDRDKKYGSSSGDQHNSVMKELESEDRISNEALFG